MREQLFIRKNTERWKQFDALISEKENNDPDILADLFVQTTDDLAYSRTFYPTSKTTKYLNSLALRVHQRIYAVKKEKWSRLLAFWKTELPLIYADQRKSLMFALVFFLISVVVGVISAANDDTYPRLILGDHYVNMTIENIKSGDPMAVYKSSSRVPMFLFIAFNNIRVAFMAFTFGLFCSLGTLFILLNNGIMLGTFQYFFYKYDLLFESALVIWIHGTLEISAIIIAGAAGLTMGNSMLFPGTYTRMQSFMSGAKKGVKMCFGLIPIFIAAAFLEGFVTRWTEMPIFLSLGIIASSLAFVIWYFFLYPIKVSKQLQ